MENVNQAAFWQQRYEQDSIGWDMGQVSPPLKAYIDQLPDTARTQAILVAGAGNAHEVAYLHEQGCSNVTLLDIAPAPIEAFAARHPSFPAERLLRGDFFELSPTEHQFDLILEQTFFCAINPNRRDDYVRQMAALLKPTGKLVGVLFDKDFGSTSPPFGGSMSEYQQRFAPYFHIDIMQPCDNSHPSRLGNELFIKLTPKAEAHD